MNLTERWHSLPINREPPTPPVPSSIMSSLLLEYTAYPFYALQGALDVALLSQIKEVATSQVVTEAVGLLTLALIVGGGYEWYTLKRQGWCANLPTNVAYNITKRPAHSVYVGTISNYLRGYANLVDGAAIVTSLYAEPSLFLTNLISRTCTGLIQSALLNTLINTGKAEPVNTFISLQSQRAQAFLHLESGSPRRQKLHQLLTPITNLRHSVLFDPKSGIKL